MRSAIHRQTLCLRYFGLLFGKMSSEGAGSRNLVGWSTNRKLSESPTRRQSSQVTQNRYYTHNPAGRYPGRFRVGINVNSGFGGTPITGTVISGNVIDHEAIEIAVNTPAQVEVHLNNLLDDTIGVDNLGLGVVNATENWWGCPGGPGAEECAGVGGAGVLFSPWLRHPFDEDDKDKK
jgi:hypothetical protein